MYEKIGDATATPTNQTVTLNEANNWMATFNNLPIVKDGKTVTYSVVEEAVNGYDTTYSSNSYEASVDQPGSIAITNTVHDPKDVTVSGTKTWVDGGKVHNNVNEIVLTLLCPVFIFGLHFAKINVIGADFFWLVGRNAFVSCRRANFSQCIGMT